MYKDLEWKQDTRDVRAVMTNLICMDFVDTDVLTKVISKDWQAQLSHWEEFKTTLSKKKSKRKCFYAIFVWQIN